MGRRPLGDAHNFGRRVTADGDAVHKPRSIAWERLLLSARSPLRRALTVAAEDAELEREAFGFLPDLTYRSTRMGYGGSATRLALRPLGRLTAAQREDLAGITGRSLALWSWLGVSDLHWENLVLGRASTGRIVFSPVDIESILDDFDSPIRTKLLPDPEPDVAPVCRHAAGVRRVLPFLGKPVPPHTLATLLAHYHSALAALDAHAKALATAIESMPRLEATPIRVCLRGTDEYVHARTEPVWPPLLDAEAEQLMRGDIPYFFRLLGRPGIHYYADPTLRSIRSLPTRGDVPRLEPLLSLNKSLRSVRRRDLREGGLFAIVGALDHIGTDGRHESGGLVLSLSSRRVRIELEDGTRLDAPRNLRSLVESAYLPCRCGEVRSVFVPSITRCLSSDS